MDLNIESKCKQLLDININLIHWWWRILSGIKCSNQNRRFNLLFRELGFI